MILPLLWRPIAAPRPKPPTPNTDPDFDELFKDGFDTSDTKDVSRARSRTLADLDRVVVDAAREQMKAFGSKSPAFKGTAKMVAAYGMMAMDRTGQLRMLKAIAARPDDAKFHDLVRRLVTYPSFRKLDAATLDKVVTAFEQMSNAEAGRCLHTLKKAEPSEREALLERISRKARVVIDGISFRMDPKKGPYDRKALEKIAGAVNRANKLIADPKLRVSEVVVADTTTRFALYNGKPVLLLHPTDVDAGVATHEIGHAVFHALRFSPKAKKDVALRLVDIYTRLGATKSVKARERTSKGNPFAERPAGLWIFDPSQWSKTVHTEHPWDDADELFASALRAYQTDRPGLEAAIAKFEKMDPAAGAAARELLALLDELHGNKSTSKPLSKSARKSAKAGLDRIQTVNNVEDTIWARYGMDSVRRALGFE